MYALLVIDSAVISTCASLIVWRALLGDLFSTFSATSDLGTSLTSVNEGTVLTFLLDLRDIVCHSKKR